MTSDKRPLMKCGHTANAVIKSSAGVEIDPPKPICIICHGIMEGADIIDLTPPPLNGRKARCNYCENQTDSDLNLPFFKYEPQLLTDSYYCGCRGWN